MTSIGEIERLRKERTLYANLLELAGRSDMDRFLRGALALIVELSGAQQGYIQLADVGLPPDTASWWLSEGFADDEVEAIRAAISQGIVSQAVATGQTVRTASAVADPRFSERGSVQAKEIASVLCAPVVTADEPARGVVYLQGEEPFDDESESDARLFVAQLAPLVDRLVASRRLNSVEDPTAPFRAQIVGHEALAGSSEALAAVFKTTALVASLDMHLLIIGPTGTGKTALARVIASNGRRARGPFVELNCAAVPDELFESELFGALSGAHSTARTDLKGKVAAAQNGTLFLDEVAELSPRAQAKLLQFLQSKTYFPLGGTTPLTADVRVIAATNVPLAELGSESRFRQDLLHRLAVMPIELPSLERRRVDIVPLARALCAQAYKRHGLPSMQLSSGAENAVYCAPWPGNVRQLANAIERGVVVANGDGRDVVETRDVFPSETRETPTYQEAMRRFQRGLVMNALAATDWNVSAAAQRLDVSRAYLYRLIQTFGLERS